MNTQIYTSFQIREVFHLEFLRWFSRKMTSAQYVLKGGVNLRLFFKSIRYSEDMDIDVSRVSVEKLKIVTLDILMSRGFSDSLRSFGIEKIVPPDIAKAKQTDTTQRFKVHVFTTAGQDLFTKIEFSRRGLKGKLVVEPVDIQILRSYKMAPLLVPHYDTPSAVLQKIQALAQRTVVQARDIFDLFLLNSQLDLAEYKMAMSEPDILTIAMDNVFLVDFPQFRDSVVAYLQLEDQKTYASPMVWDEIKLKVSHFLEEIRDAAA
ncbi:MAG: nucleotidyl transferase AbiEii/AbiGii toxin family protein [Candidatus Omnitrophica bacterium]|nr:nucleotidyl transferase AbiEii/AbiGii toxin family protein [Candidatus Omnitrophota bacterium]